MTKFSIAKLFEKKIIAYRRINILAWFLIGISLLLRSILTYRAGYYWDDFIILSKAHGNPVPWNLAWQTYDGHTMPAAILSITLCNALAPFHWWLPATVLVILQFFLDYGIWRLCRKVCELRIGYTDDSCENIPQNLNDDTHIPLKSMLMPLAFFLFSPLTIVQNIWWSAGINTLPLCCGIVAALLCALGCSPTTVQPMRIFRSALIVIIAILFYEKAVIIPVIVLSVLWLMIGYSQGAYMIVKLWRLWWYWGVLSLCTVIYALWAWGRITLVSGHHSFNDAIVLTFVGAKLLFPVLIFGGPWSWSRWIPGPPIAFPTPIITVLSGIASLFVVYFLWKKRSLSLLIGVVCYYTFTIIPITYARSSQYTSVLLTNSLRYFADFSVFITLMILLGIKYKLYLPQLSLINRVKNKRQSLLIYHFTSIVTISGCISLANVYSTITVNPSNEYIKGIRTEISHNALLFDQTIPANILTSLTWPNNKASAVFASLHPQIVSAKPDALILGPDGRLHFTQWTPLRHIIASCGNSFHLDGPLIPFEWLIKLSYQIPNNISITIGFPGYPVIHTNLQAQKHSYYLRLYGKGNQLNIFIENLNNDSSPNFCVTGGEIYAFNPL